MAAVSAITVPALSIFSSVHADTGAMSATFGSASAIFLVIPAGAGLKSACFLAELRYGNGVGAFSAAFPSPGGAAFDAMAG